MKKEERNKYVIDQAVWKGKIKGHDAYIVPSPGMAKKWRENDYDCGLNGYVVYKKRPTIEKGYNGILNYVPVWGGITYCETEGDGTMYGFDTSHIGQEKLPVRDPKWIKRQIRIMIDGIERAAKVERKYLRALTNKGKAKHAQYVMGKNKTVDQLGFGAMINVLSGEL